jgi:hypothetical protein
MPPATRGCLLVRFDGLGHEQVIDILSKNIEDEEAVEFRPLAQLRRICCLVGRFCEALDLARTNL